MKFLRLMMLALPLVLSGCSTMLTWVQPSNWFGSSSTTVSEQGVDGLNAMTAMNETAIADGLNNDYHLRSGMKMVKGEIIPYYEATKDNKVMLRINGHNGTLKRIDIMDQDIESESGVKIGTPFGDLFDKAFGICEPGMGDDVGLVICKAPGSSHISYVFKGNWNGPESLLPPDASLKKWTLHKIIWQQ